MAQNIVKSIKSERPPKQVKNGLEELPEVKRTERQPKIVKASEAKRRGYNVRKPQLGINFGGKPKVIENGTKIK